MAKAVKIEDGFAERFETFCDENGFSQKFVATRGIEMFMKQYEADE